MAKKEAPTTAASEPLTPGFAAEFLAHLTRSFEARDLDAVMEVCSEDLVYQDAGPSSEISREETRRMWTPIFAAMEHTQATVLESFLSLEGDTVAAHWQYTFKHRDVVEPFEIETVAIYAFRDGLVCRWTTIFRNFDWMGDVWP